MTNLVTPTNVSSYGFGDHMSNGEVTSVYIPSGGSFSLPFSAFKSVLAFPGSWPLPPVAPTSLSLVRALLTLIRRTLVEYTGPT